MLANRSKVILGQVIFRGCPKRVPSFFMFQSCLKDKIPILG